MTSSGSSAVSPFRVASPRGARGAQRGRTSGRALIGCVPNQERGETGTPRRPRGAESGSGRIRPLPYERRQDGSELPLHVHGGKRLQRAVVEHPAGDGAALEDGSLGLLELIEAGSEHAWIVGGTFTSAFGAFLRARSSLRRRADFLRRPRGFGHGAPGPGDVADELLDQLLGLLDESGSSSTLAR